MEDKFIPRKIDIEDYFLDLPYSDKERLHHYREGEKTYIDELGRRINPFAEEKRKGKVFGNMAYRIYGEGSFEAFAFKLPSGDIITTDKKFAKRLKKDKHFLLEFSNDEWANEKALEDLEKFCRKEGLKDVKSYKVLLKI